VSCFLETAENDTRIPMEVTGCDLQPVVVLQKLDLSRMKYEYNVHIDAGPYYYNVVRMNDDLAQRFTVNGGIPTKSPGSTAQHLNMSDRARVATGKQIQAAEDDKQRHAGPDSTSVSAVVSVKRTGQFLTDRACCMMFTDSYKHNADLCSAFEV